MAEVIKDHTIKHATLEGILERIVFLNEESGFTVARLQVARRRDLVTIVGSLPSPTPGETLRLKGEWVMDAKFGEQFRVETCLSVLPSTITGIQKYLGSGLVKGIGPVMARRLVDTFDLDTLDIIGDSPERLEEVEGIVRWSPKIRQVAKSGFCSYNEYGIGGEHETEPKKTHPIVQSQGGPGSIKG